MIVQQFFVGGIAVRTISYTYLPTKGDKNERYNPCDRLE